MAPAKLELPQANPRAILRGVLADAAKTVPEARRTPSLMACLAEKILTLAADGQENQINLRRLAVERVLESCPGCRACDGLQAARNGGRSRGDLIFSFPLVARNGPAGPA